MPTDRERIEQWSLRYHLLKTWTDFCFKIYFKTTVIGLKEVPFDKSLIFAANHQNSLIDALAILSMRRWQPVFLARADVFKTATLRKILTLFKILPVYRIRDGYSNLQLNDEIFLKTLDVLKNHNGIGMFPEGNHFGQRRLRELKKGIARIAFQSEDATNNELKIHIIPIGLNYTNYINFRSKLLINIGQPIDISKHLELYRQNPALGYNALIADLEKGMKQVMIQIEDKTYYDEYEMLRDIYTLAYIREKKLSRRHQSQFEIDKKMIASVDDLKTKNQSRFQSLMEEVRTYSSMVKETGLTPRTFQTSSRKLWSLLIRIPLLLITLPLFIYGFVNNIVSIVAPYQISKKIKDEQFISSIRFVVGMFIFPIMFLVQTLVFWAISGNGTYALIYLATLPIGAAIAYLWRKYALDALNDFKLMRFKSVKAETYYKIKSLDSSIRSIVGEV